MSAGSAVRAPHAACASRDLGEIEIKSPTPCAAHTARIARRAKAFGSHTMTAAPAAAAAAAAAPILPSAMTTRGFAPPSYFAKLFVIVASTFALESAMLLRGATLAQALAFSLLAYKAYAVPEAHDEAKMNAWCQEKVEVVKKRSRRLTMGANQLLGRSIKAD